MKLSKGSASFLKNYWIHILMLFFVVGYGIKRQIELRNYAQSCMTRTQIQSDTRCLYIFNGNVYQKGTKSNPHHGHTCGSDVSTVMESSHNRSVSAIANYLDPSLIGAVCSGSVTSTPTATMTPSRTPTPTNITVLTPTRTPTSTPVVTSTLTPTLMPGAQVVEFRIKLAGVTGSQAQSSKITVKFVKTDSTVIFPAAPLVLTHIGAGVYKATTVVNSPMPTDTKFVVKIKGEKHVSVTFCRQIDQISPCSDGQYMTVPGPVPSSDIFDFTGINLPPGDLPVQDGRADRADLEKLALLLSKPYADLTVTDKLVGDVNYDGFINVRDVFLILQTLETRFDQ